MTLASRFVACALTAGTLVPAAAQADIYRYVDEHGTVHFTNVPDDNRFKLYMTTRRDPDLVSNALASRGVRPYSTEARKRYHAHILAAARVYSLEPALLHAVISAESGYDALARSPKGARGLMQLMPDTARRYGVQNPLDPEQNIYGGAAYLRDLLTLFGNDLKLALAAYNAGEGSVLEYGNRIPPYRETTRYVPKVLSYYQRYKTMM
ncbi:MAG TPA: lytic transglycosylase domain-containing protein [Burkholderiales bacterium]|nr:lytic transglycosylase domain-containing protein [Burkholderiales bacterium]